AGPRRDPRRGPSARGCRSWSAPLEARRARPRRSITPRPGAWRGDARVMSDPVIPEPDDKDWTWTLRRPCPDCGFDAGGTAAAEVPRIVDDVVSRVTGALAGARPAPAPGAAR